MNDEKLLEIAARLLERTLAGEIPWSETADANTFSTAFPDYSVSIAFDPPGFLITGASNTSYVFSVFNEKGTVVESTRGSTNALVDTVLKPLYESARSRTLKSEEILDDLLTRLSTDS